MQLGDAIIPEVLCLDQHAKGTIIECLVARLYETEGANTRLAELMLACMIQSLVWFTIYDIESKRSQVWRLSR